MKSNLSTLFAVVVLSCGFASPVVMGEKKSNNKPIIVPSVITESCVLKISWDENASSLNTKVVEALLRSSGVWGKALSETFGDNTAQIRDSISVSLTPLSGWTRGRSQSSSVIVARLVIKFANDPPSASNGESGRLLVMVCKKLNRALVAFGESTVISTHEKRKRFEEELQRARGEVHKILAERQAFLETAQTSELNHKRLTLELRKLQKRKLDLEMDRSVSRARRDAMQVQVARIVAQSRGIPFLQRAIEQFTKTVAFRQAALDEAKELSKAGEVSSEELVKLEVALWKAEKELALVRGDPIRDCQDMLGSDIVTEMNHRLTELAIDEADQEAKHAAILERLERAEASLKVAEEYEQLGGSRLEFAKHRLETVERDLAEIERRISTLARPTMIVIGAN